jgi:hypothetical protein
MVIYLSWMQPIPLPGKFTYKECSSKADQILAVWKTKSKKPLTVKCVSGHVIDYVKKEIEEND